MFSSNNPAFKIRVRSNKDVGKLLVVILGKVIKDKVLRRGDYG